MNGSSAFLGRLDHRTELGFGLYMARARLDGGVGFQAFMHGRFVIVYAYYAAEFGDGLYSTWSRDRRMPSHSISRARPMEGSHKHGGLVGARHAPCPIVPYSRLKYDEEELGDYGWAAYARPWQGDGARPPFMASSRSTLVSFLAREFCFDHIYVTSVIMEAICSSLEDYNKQIELLKEEMNDATCGADSIRNDVSALAQRYAVIERDEDCGLLIYSRHMRRSCCDNFLLRSSGYIKEPSNQKVSRVPWQLFQ
ncbi:hypothetical protein Dimus_022872 [Dionaea muscipula]